LTKQFGNMTQAPKYLTGDASGINDFIERFDVRDSDSIILCLSETHLQALTSCTP
jgi:hypothetical protein